MPDFDEERLGVLLRELPAPPQPWMRAAAELPAARRALDDLVRRSEADAELRAHVLGSLESALADAGVEPDRRNAALLRARLDPLAG